ncbi:MAG: hypothetical protein P1U67_06465 [Alcanivoracaceae bacterium]|nr:hypothetical protein [Alcanivoracaceae bacterium]
MIPYHSAQPARPDGHYESWFVRGNHPHQPQAFWIRYTRFIPRDTSRDALGEIWAIWFDGDQDNVVVVKEEFPLDLCEFSNSHLHAQIGKSVLSDHQLRGEAKLNGNSIRWSLNYQGDDNSLLFLPENLYAGKLPRAKSVISRPQIALSGELIVNGETIALDNWLGSENHNWGSRHTDQYAWGQVAAFDNMPEAFLECITARVKIGPLPSPWMTLACVRLEGKDYLFNSLSNAFRAKAAYQFFDWRLHTENGDAELDVSFEAPPRHFAALTYYNPSKGNKTCLNSKIATCRLTLRREGHSPLTLTSRHGAAFEILTDREDHGRPLMT